MSDKIYVIGHKSPDLDSVASAIAYAHYRNTMEGTDKYLPAVAGEANKETAYALEKYGYAKPEIITSAEGRQLILVDHNESVQSIDGADGSQIIAILDHHKIDFKLGTPIYFEVRPWGATCTIIADKYFKKNIEINSGLAGLMLSAILVDTVITKSPTCTDHDKEIIEKLAALAGIGNWREYGMELFKVRSAVQDLSIDQIINYDFKDFILGGKKIGIGQIETVDLGEFAEKEREIIQGLDKIRQEKGYHSVVLFITDIIKEGSKFHVASEDAAKIEAALGAELKDNTVYIDGIISRKKQVAPKFTEAFENKI